MGVIARLAACAPAAVLPVAGRDRLLDLERLGLDARLRLASTPRDASVLLVAGDVGGRMDALALLHDRLPHPRATPWWGAARPEGWDGERAGDDPAADAARLWAALARGERASEPDRLPDEPPVAWRGVGPHGQGGKGMMGGTPYGRPMAMTGEDRRDGLQLDAYALRIGPFAGVLPPGLRLEATLQGDVIQGVRVVDPPLPQAGLDGAPLLLAARMLRLLGLGPLAERCARAHFAGGPGPRALVRLSGARLAVPPDLAPMGDGSDARARLGAWLGGEAIFDEPGEETLGSLLAGLEWHAAALALASLPPASLDRLCREALQDQAESERDDEGEDEDGGGEDGGESEGGEDEDGGDGAREEAQGHHHGPARREGPAHHEGHGLRPGPGHARARRRGPPHEIGRARPARAA